MISTMNTTQQKITMPLMQRLIDEHPDEQHELGMSNFISLSALQDDIKENISALLNHRLELASLNDKFSELKKSILAYGMLDFTQPEFSWHKQQQLLCQHIKQVLNHFEPRLQKVRVTVVAASQKMSRSLQLRIVGEINLKPTVKTAAYETIFDAVNVAFDVREEQE